MAVIDGERDYILIIAPCPLVAPVAEGYMSRIRAVDKIFEGTTRIYVNPASEAREEEPIASRYAEKVFEYKLNLLNDSHLNVLEKLILRSRFVYVHTIHFARFLLPFYPTGKIVTDVHGIVPEEERMLGHPERAIFYEGVERVVMTNSRAIVVVTEAMRRHLITKHADTNAQFIVLPIIESYGADLRTRPARIPQSRYRAIYAGGTQVWQNIDLMLNVADRAVEFCDFDFLSHEHQFIRAQAADRPSESSSTFGVATKDQLPSFYVKADFGFVLRDDTAVNRVSCPTKLSEYMWFGIIPIVKCTSIGDFAEAGYSYLTADEFAAGLIPDEATARQMREHNRAVIGHFSECYHKSREILRQLKLANAIRGNTLAGLPIGQRYLFFPNQAELYLFGAATHYFVREIIEPFHILSWTPDVAEPAHALRLIPILANVALELEEVEVDTEAVDISSVHIRCLSPGTAGADAVYLRKENPSFDVHFSTPVIIRRVVSKWTFVTLGAHNPALHDAAHGRTVTITLRVAATAETAKSVVDVAFAS